MQNYVPPRANQGMQILWYKRGILDRTAVEVAYMLQLGARTAVIVTASGRRLDAVRHIEDPKLMLSADQRENGAWDFTEDFKEAIVFRKAVNDRFCAIEKALQNANIKVQSTDPNNQGSKAKPGSNKMAPGLARYHENIKRAKDLGLLVKVGMPRDELEQMLLEATGTVEPSIDSVPTEELAVEEVI
jgi:hypothetical protein